MNPELPPLPLSQPTIKARRRERPPFITLPPFALIERTEKCRILRGEIAEIANASRQLSPEQRRAIFLKLRHDRPLTKLDLKHTGLVLMAPSAEKESLVVPRKEDIEKLDKQLREFSADQVSDRPKGTEFVTRITSISIADPKDRLSPELAAEYAELITEPFVIYEIEVASFAMRSSTRSKEVEATLEELRQFLGVSDGRISHSSSPNFVPPSLAAARSLFNTALGWDVCFGFATNFKRMIESRLTRSLSSSK